MKVINDSKKTEIYTCARFIKTTTDFNCNDLIIKLSTESKSHHRKLVWSTKLRLQNLRVQQPNVYLIAGYRDLIRVKVECEISNNGTVSLIEERLPRGIKREWSREVNKSGSVVEEKNKFPYLLKFLQEQRKIIEYESSDLRSGNPVLKGHANLINAEGKLIDDKMSPEEKIRPEDKARRCLVLRVQTT